MDTVSETINAIPSDTPPDFDDPRVPYFNLVYFIIFFGLVIGVCVVYNTLNNRRHGRRSGRGSPFTMWMNAGDELAYQAMYGFAVNNNNSNVNDRVRKQQRTKIIQTADEVVFDISPMGNHPRRRLAVMSKTQPALLRSFEPTDEHDKMVCAICLDPLDIRRVAAFPCNHPMHEDCFRNWVVKTSRLDCPMCGQDFSTYGLPNSSTSSGEAVADIRQ